MTDPEREARIKDLTERFRELGATNLEGCVEGEIDDNEAVLAHYLFMHNIWPRSIDRWRADTSWVDRHAKRSEAVKQALDLGVKPETLGLIAARVALDVIFDLLIKLDDGSDPHAREGSPGWMLMETDSDGNPTGRDIDGFHSVLLLLDPSGKQGKDLQ